MQSENHKMEYASKDFSQNGNYLEFDDLILERRDDTHNSIHVQMQQDSRHSYGSCSMHWRDLSVVDHALLAKMAYSNPMHGREMENMTKMLDFAFPKSNADDAKLVDNWYTNLIQIEQLKNPDTFYKFYQINFHKHKHTVITVQGIEFSDSFDVFADFRLWLISALLDLA